MIAVVRKPPRHRATARTGSVYGTMEIISSASSLPSNQWRGRDAAMRLNTSMTSVVIPGLIAGVIYLVIAFATGASAAASIIGGVVVAVIAIAIGFVFRAIFKRRAESRR